MLADECHLGDKIEIIYPGSGAYGCQNNIGYITDKKASHGIGDTDPGINVELENGGIWRIIPEANVKRLEKADPTHTSIPNVAREMMGLDPIKPSYYNDTKITPFDVIDDWSLNFYLGNAIKYIKRAGKKDGNSRLQDLKKVREYIDHEIKAEEDK